MKKMKKIFAAALTVAVLFGAMIPANAATTEVSIEIKETTMDGVSVTVPTTLPIVFNEDGTNTFPTNWKIENISTIAGIHLAEIQMDGSEAQWNLLSEAEDTTTMPADTKSIQFWIGKSGDLRLVEPTNGEESTTGSITFADTDISLASGESQVLSFDVERGAFTTSEASAKAFDMVMIFEFNK